MTLTSKLTVSPHGLLSTMRFLVYFPAVLAVSTAWAAGAVEHADTARVLDEVVVTENVAKAPVALLPLDVKIVTSQTLESSGETNVLPVLQHRIPGMFVTERGIAGYSVSGGSAGNVSIRGVGAGNKVLFLIDGQPQWAGVFGHALADTYLVNDIDRVEVVSGPSSLLYGSGAMGGSVNLITQRADRDGFYGALKAAAGSYGTMQYAAKAGYKRGGLRAFMAAGYERTDGSRRGMYYRLANGFASLSYQVSRHWDVGGNMMLTQSLADNPGSVFLPRPLDMWAKIFRSTAAVFVKNSYSISSGGVQAYYNMGNHEIDDGIKNGQPRPYLFHSRDYNMGLTAYQTLKPWLGNALSVGIDFKRVGGRAWNSAKSDGSKTRLVDKYVNEMAGYAMMQQSFWGTRLSLNAGLRYEHSSQFGDQWVPQAGFILCPMPLNRIKFSYGKGFRSPTIRELYMYEARNPDLKPESLNNFEVEVRQWLLDSRLNIGAALFYIKGDNLIQTVYIDGSQRNINTGNFINKGFEVDATFKPAREWELVANYAYLYTDTRIVAAPRNKLFARVGYTPGNWQFALEVLNIGHLLTEQTKESYALLNARVAYTLDRPKALTLFVKGENLTATKYQINYGFPMPRATFLAGAEWHF